MSEPDENSMDQFRMKPQTKRNGTDNVSVISSEEVKCEKCERIFP